MLAGDDMSAETSQTLSLVPGDPATDVKVLFPAPFGAYLLLHRIGRGGMGDVFLAKTGGMMGIEKHCVVKTLRARYSSDDEYVERFVEEARLVVQLSHRNICPVFDVGRVGPSFYLAMELVIGRNVRAVVDELASRGTPLPPECAVHVATELLDALDYAHRHVDPATGRPLHLVHRDISPQNVLVNFEGEVKLIDFGLAETGREATSEHSSTGSQAVMGKLAYMAPEHARAEVVDPRADQFSAAVVIYEMLAGERYYAGLSSQEIWQSAGIGTYVPRRLDALDPDMVAILRRALAPEKDDRFRTCGELRDAILEYARVHALPAGGPALRRLMNETFAGDLVAIRELMQGFAGLSAKPTPGFTTVRTPAAPASSSSDVFSIATSVHAQTIHDPTQLILRSQPMPAPRRAAGLAAVGVIAVAAVAVVAVAAVAAVVVLRPDRPAPPPVAAMPAPVATPPAPVPAAAPAAPDAADAAPPTPPPTPAPPTRRPRPTRPPPASRCASTAAARTATRRRCSR